MHASRTAKFDIAFFLGKMEAPPGFEPGVEVLQSEETKKQKP